MTAKLVITIDTEEDTWGEWKTIDNSTENINRIPLLQKMFDDFAAIPTYLVNYPVIINKQSCNVMRRLHENDCCEIGLHIHPWNTPPLAGDMHKVDTMIRDLPYQLCFDKILTLHNEIKDRIGFEPKCFRAGRWGFGPVVAKCIFELGYQIDTSVTPFCDWTNDDGPDFTDAPPLPYRFSPQDILSEDPDGTLFEIPPTIGFLQKNSGRCARVRQLVLETRLSRYHILGLFDRLRLINLRWLSPELTNSLDMIKLAKSLIAQGYRCLNMSFHSNSLLPGLNPFVKSEQELDNLLSNIALFLKFASENGFKFSSLSRALDTNNEER